MIFCTSLQTGSIKVADIVIESRCSVKLLGMFLDSKLRFNEHISSLYCKASNRVNALPRFSRTLDSVTKLTIIRSFVSCYFNYRPLVWHFCGNECSKALERIQFRTLKFVYNDFKSSCAELLEISGMSSLYQQRIRFLATEMYKLYYKQGPTYLHSLITRKCYTVARNGKAVEQPRCKTSRYGLNSLRYQGAKLSNSLCDNFKDAVTLNDFKNLIRVCEGNECHCSYCFLCILTMS